MPAKRALKLEAVAKSNHETTPDKENHRLRKIFSPTTGTCQRSPSLSPARKNEKKRKLTSNERAELNPLEAGPSSRGQTQIVEKDDYMVLVARAEKSLVNFLKMRESLKNIKALEGSRELENIFGVSNASSDLKAELQKNKELMVEVKKRKLMQPNTKHP